ncbi:uncharacterized protein LOC133286133 [Gastrolobium bilobum]|uniref:uncharacterized protein LOC133286133 n=1 Tax=Gastrolobium bilobum TaxID=150636 RepID=UPI002AB26C42|nr:uncharacterized protein LOC133286133 [Gastrolobium bilobum]
MAEEQFDFRIYNSMTQQKEIFKPKVPGNVSMYVCGVTAYDYSHLGHARAAVSFDILFRYLKHLGYEVTYVRNFTDVDDKEVLIKLQAKNTRGFFFQGFPCSTTKLMLNFQGSLKEGENSSVQGSQLGHYEERCYTKYPHLRPSYAANVAQSDSASNGTLSLSSEDYAAF